MGKGIVQKIQVSNYINNSYRHVSETKQEELKKLANFRDGEIRYVFGMKFGI